MERGLSQQRNIASVALKAAGSLLIPRGLTFISYHFVPVNSTTAALIFLLAVLAVATTWGLTEAVCASVSGWLCLNYFFLDPVGTFSISHPQDWVALTAFLVTSLVTSQLSARVKRRASEALRREEEMERLYELSRRLLLLDNQSPIAGQVSSRIVDVFGVAGVAVFDRAEGRVYRTGSAELDIPDGRLRDTAVQGIPAYDRPGNIFILPLKLGGDPVGSLAISGGSISDTALQAIGNLAAIATERARAQDAASRMAAARHNEAMKATLLDALAHEFKTPLTAIKAAASSVLDGAQQDQKELVTIIEEEADRLDTLVSETIRMARIDAGNLRLEKQPHLIGDIVTSALTQLRTLLDGRDVRIELPREPLQVLADAELIALTIRQLVGNALKYSNPESPIVVRAREAGGTISVGVKDSGPGIPESERSRIFEKFYRAADSSAVPGSGMGLAIAREIVRAHGGELSVNSLVGQGSEFTFTLPAVESAK